MKKIAPKGTTLPGIDVSHYDEVIDFAKVKSSGRFFVIAKCTEYNADKTYERNRVQAKAAGLVFGAYHFFHPSRDPEAQAKKFLLNAKLGPGDLPAVLDWETTDGVPTSQDKRNARIWMDIVEHETKKPCIIYGAPYFLDALALDSTFAKHPLWVAHYGTKAPLVPGPWTDWSFWQYSDKGEVPGIPAPNEDLDIFNGTLDDLKKLVL